MKIKITENRFVGDGEEPMSRRKKVGRPEGRGDDIAARTLELARLAQDAHLHRRVGRNRARHALGGLIRAD